MNRLEQLQLNAHKTTDRYDCFHMNINEFESAIYSIYRRSIICLVNTIDKLVYDNGNGENHLVDMKDLELQVEIISDGILERL